MISIARGSAAVGGPAERALFVDGAALAFRLYDIGYAIDLERVRVLLGREATARVRPERSEARALQISNPPIAVPLGTVEIAIAGEMRAATITARLYDFGACSLELDVRAPAGLPWSEFSAFGSAVDASPAIAVLLDERVAALRVQIGEAVQRPSLATVIEDYVVFRITRLADGAGAVVRAAELTDDHLVPLLLHEQRPLSAAARGELLHHRFSYYADDLTILTWDNALVVDPRADDRDVEYILEFANAQLLELRFYDALLDAELPEMFDRVASTRGRLMPVPFRGRYRPVLARIQARVADVTETLERVENALKVTDDVYLARIYGAALELFRGSAWRSGIERKLAIIRETYEMFNAEAQTARAELLELAVIALIVIEIVLGVLVGRKA